MNSRDIFIALALSAAVAGATTPAYAQTPADKAKVDAAKAAGTVGEQADGLLGFPGAAPDAETRAAVSAINAGRAQVYREAATRNGVSEPAAGASAHANVILPRLPAGQYYRGTDGVWKRK